MRFAGKGDQRSWLLYDLGEKNFTFLSTPNRQGSEKNPKMDYIHPTAIYVPSIVVEIETYVVYRKCMISAPVEPTI